MYPTNRETFKAEVNAFRKSFTLGEMAKAIAIASKKPEVEGVIAAMIGARTEKPMDFSRAADLMAEARFNVDWNTLSAALKGQSEPDVPMFETSFDLEAYDLFSADGFSIASKISPIDYDSWTAEKFLDLFFGEVEWSVDGFDLLETGGTDESNDTPDGIKVVSKSLFFESHDHHPDDDSLAGSFSLMIDTRQGKLVEYSANVGGKGVAVDCPLFAKFKGKSFNRLKAGAMPAVTKGMSTYGERKKIIEKVMRMSPEERRAIIDGPSSESLQNCNLLGGGETIDIDAILLKFAEDHHEIFAKLEAFPDVQEWLNNPKYAQERKRAGEFFEKLNAGNQSIKTTPDYDSWSAEEFCDYFFGEAEWGDKDVSVKETGGIETYDDKDGITIVSQTVYFESYERPDDDSVSGTFSLMIDNRQGKLVEYTASMGSNGLQVHCPSFLGMKGRPYRGLCDMTYARMTSVYVVREDEDEDLFELLKVLSDVCESLEDEYQEGDLVEILTEAQMQMRFAWNVRNNKPIIQEQRVPGSHGTQKILISLD